MTTTPKILQSLHLPFSEDRISWRAGARQGGMAQALPYIDNRVIMDTLDAQVGPENWYNEYVEVLAGTRLIAVRCTLYIRLDAGWVGKSDAAPVTLSREDAGDMAVKGAYSDAMKRAAVHWGLGRYLYAFAAPWVAVNERGGLLEIPALPAHMLPEGAAVRPTAVAPAPEAAPPVKAVRPAAVAPAPEVAAVDDASEVLLLSEEQQNLVNGLLLRLGKLPPEMLRQYVEGPKGQEKLTAAARAHVLGKITAYELAIA